jgi:hypothetical protein
MKTIIKLLVAAVFLNALAQGAWASWRYYQFKDAMEEALLFSEFTSLERVHERLVELAREHDVPIESDAISVKRQGLITQVDAAYTEQVRLVPRLYEPVWTWDASVAIRAVR